MRAHLVCQLTVISALLPFTIQGQAVQPERWSIESRVGAFYNGYDVGDDGSKVGALAGLRGGYLATERLRVVADAAYARSHDVSFHDAPSYYVYGSEWVLAAAGVEYDLLQGQTSVAAGLELGATWSRFRVRGQIGTPPLSRRHDQRDFATGEAFVPTLSVRRALSRRIAITAAIHDYILDVIEGPARHSPSLTLGVTLH